MGEEKSRRDKQLKPRYKPVLLGTPNGLQTTKN